MGYLLINNISLSNIKLRKDPNENYRICYWDKNISLNGLPLYCKGFIRIVNDKFHFVIRDTKYQTILTNIENHFKRELDDYHGFIRKFNGDYFIIFNQNEHTNRKLNKKTTELYLNFKFIKKYYYTTIIHIYTVDDT